jgi:hypothetical protein
MQEVMVPAPACGRPSAWLYLRGDLVKRTLLAVLAALVGAGAVLAEPTAEVLPAPAYVLPPTFAPADTGPASPRVWGQVDYLLWSIKDAPLPVPLVTAGPGVPNLTPVLGTPGHTVVLGGQDVSTDLHSGARFTAGYWYDDDHVLGTSATYFFLGSQMRQQSVGSSGLPGSLGLQLPFFDVNVPGESSTRIAQPGEFAGTAALSITNSMQSVEWNGLAQVFCQGQARVYLLGGLRWWQFNEGLLFLTTSPSVVPPQDIFGTEDRFTAHNNFWAGQIGAQAEYQWDRVLVRAEGKVAFGGMHEQVRTSGLLVTNDFNNFGPPQAFPGGYLAQPTNSGFPSKTRFAVLPELNLSVGYQVTDWLSVQVGYSFLYASSVVRPGDQIDRGINPTQAPAINGNPSTTAVGQQRPIPLLTATDFWAQGVTLGVGLRF